MQQPLQSYAFALLLGSIPLLTPGFAAAQSEQEKQVKQKKAAEGQEKAEAQEASARAAEFKAKGLVEVRGVWVEKKHLADAKKGVFHHEGELVNRWEKRQYQDGLVRHPITGRFIAKADLAKARDQFPLADGEWGPKDKANQYHENRRHPWVIRTRHCNVVSTLPLDTILHKVVPQVDSAYNKLQPIFGFAAPPPERRPLVLVLADTGSFTSFGDDYGGAGSAHGAFLTEQHTMRVYGSRMRVGAALWDKSWGPYYVRHAAALATSHAFCGDQTDSVPEWFHRGLGGLVEQHFNAGEAKYLAKVRLKSGKVDDLEKWLEKFKISGDLPRSGKGSIGYNIFYAGMLLQFSMRGGEKESTEALQAVTAAFQKGGKLKAPIAKLAEILVVKQDSIDEFADQMLR